MTQQYFSRRNINFMLHEVFRVSELTKHEYFAHFDKEAMDMVVDSAVQIADTLLKPYYELLDKDEPTLENGEIKTHPHVKTFLRKMGEIGFIGNILPLEYGGQQMPESLAAATNFIMGAANNSLTMFTGLTTGAANLIISFGSKELQETYLPKMLSGEWQGTMALTEPHAGSSLHYISSTAEPTAHGYYKMHGQKVYISAGNHNQAENTIHLMLAKIKAPDTPAGTKGISLFVVPQKRIENGQLVDNHISNIGIYHKMGQKATPAIHLATGETGECRGWLVGEPHKGLQYMFQMMNEARIGVGITATAIASAAYYASLKYAHERPQGQRLGDKGKDPNAPQTLIINHADVRRLLFSQKAMVEGCLSLILQCTHYADMAHITQGEEKERYELLLDFLTPVAKAYPTEAGVISVSNGLQVFGGGGYCKDFPVEQMYRDIRITTIYEGTTAIQSQALLGRNIPLKNGKAAMAYFQEVTNTIQEAYKYDELKKYADLLKEAGTRLQQITQHLLGYAFKGEVELFLADATLYMEYFGIVAVAWQWLKQGIIAKEALITGKAQGDDVAFYESKIHTLKFFYHYELPKTQGLATRLLDTEVLTIPMEKEIFA
ncbi:MAG: acyl-CoA dehydrogenase [Microscillaceae bacterium]|nr:acyl-CoA dehydrogenase [Microscillaceae bacterium]MDW8461298.1 acyl-CoA dehydrogenase [Cytophagales bacterium]